MVVAASALTCRPKACVHSRCRQHRQREYCPTREGRRVRESTERLVYQLFCGSTTFSLKRDGEISQNARNVGTRHAETAPRRPGSPPH